MTLEEILKYDGIPENIKLSKDDVRKIIIKYKGLIKEFERKEAFWKSTNKNLEKVSLQLEEAFKSLKENQQKMMIIENMASLGRMTAEIAHEMNTPMAAIRASLSELEKLILEYEQSITNPDVTIADHKDISSEMKETHKIINNGIMRIVNFVQNIKSQTRDLSPKNRHIFNAVPIIHDTILLLNHNLIKNNCTINFKSKNKKINIYGSEGRLIQALSSIINNAIDAYKFKKNCKGGIIDIEIVDNKTGMDLKITDKGCGIKKEILPKIFDPLFTTKNFAEGTGLGLTITYDIIISDFEGSIEVNSIPDKGSTFTIHFPKPKI